MAQNPNWPLTSFQVAFNAGVSTTGSALWSDLSSRLWSLDCDRGKQYELDQIQTGTGELVLADKDEFLNPSNLNSPWSGSIKPYRQFGFQAMWPPAPVGAAVNLFNTGAGFDPTFESYTVGSTPSWVLRFGVSPTVTTTSPFQGSNALTWNVTASGGFQGVGASVTTIPGQSYTVSVYVRQSVANTQQLSIAGHAAMDSTTTSGAYVRLAGTFTADQPSHWLLVSTPNAAASGSVTVDAIQLEPVSALNSNDGFEAGLTGWSASGSTVVASTAWFRSATTSALITPDGVSSTGYVFAANVPVTANQRYLASGWMFAKAGTSGFKCGVRVNWYDGSGTFLSTSIGTDEAPLSAGTQHLYANIFTAPASAAFASVHAAIVGTPPISVTANADEVRLLPVSPSAFSSTGPVVYGVHSGLVERWPSTWNHQGMYGYTQCDTVDGFAALAARKLHTEYRGAVLALKPDYYWPLSEPQDATSFAEISGNNGPPLVVQNSKYGAATTFQAGQQQDIPGDPGASGVETNTTNVGFLNLPTTVVQTGIPGTGTRQVTMGATAFPYSSTVSAWITHSPSLATDTGRIFLLLSDPGAQLALAFNAWFTIWQVASATQLTFNAVYSGVTVTDQWADGKPHLFVLTTTNTASSSTSVLYVDGAQVATGTFPITIVDNQVAGVVEVGGGINPQYGQSAPGLQSGVYSHLALWNRALSSSEVTALWNGGKGYPGETSGQRVARYLSGNYGGASAIDTGQSTMGVSDLAEGTILLDACLDVTASENGNFWCDGDGVLTFYSRTRRYLATGAKWVFGENQAGGENPYEDDIAYDYDPTQIYNDVQIANSGGVSTEAQDAASQTDYGPRTYQRDVNVKSDAEAIDASNWILATHKAAYQRINTLTVKPSANPALWPVALGAEIGDRVTVKRRTAAGFTASRDFFIEQISHTQAPDSWIVQFQMSPAAPVQVGILDDSTFGRIGSAGARLLSSITSAATSAVVVDTGGDWYTATTPYPATIDNEIVQVTAVTAVNDTFARTVSNGWGTATSGQPWTTSGGSASDYSVASGAGKQANNSVNVLRSSTIDIGSPDFDFTFDFQLSISTPTGAAATTWIVGRYTDASNHYVARVDTSTTGAVTLTLFKRVAGTLTSLTSAVPLGFNTSGTVWRARFRGISTVLTAKVWTPAVSPEPGWLVSTTDGDLTTGTQIGGMSRLESGNTNTLPVTWSWDTQTVLTPQTFTFTRPTDGTAAAHAANAPVQVSQPFTLAY